MPDICAPIPLLVPAQPKSIAKITNRTIPRILRPHISSAQCFMHWMTPFGLHKLDELNLHLPPIIIAHQSVIMVKAVKQKTLSNYGAGLLWFRQFCDELSIPEDLRMPAPEW